MAKLAIQLYKANATVTTVDGVETIDWTPALIAAATELQALNAVLAYPIECNPLSKTLEGFLGFCNTPPSVDGYVTVLTNAYRYIKQSLLPATPTTFDMIWDFPPESGVIQ